MIPAASIGHPQSAPPRASRRKFFVVIAALLAPVILIWFSAATIIALGLRFPLLHGTQSIREAAMAPAKPGAGGLRALIGARSEQVMLTRADASPIRAWFVAASKPAGVVLVCPNQSDPRAVAGYFDVIHTAGYAALIIDYASRINSPHRDLKWGWAERIDVINASLALRGRGVRRVAAMGVSAGAAAVIFAAADNAPIAALISDSAYAHLDALLRRTPPLESLNPAFTQTIVWEVGLIAGRPASAIAPVSAAAELGRRALMVIGGGRDPIATPSDARKIFAAASGPKEIWIVPAAGHAGALAADPHEYAGRVDAFLAKYLDASAPAN